MNLYRSKLWQAKARRSLRGRTIAEIERLAGWRKGYLNDVFTDNTDISVSRGVTLAKTLGVDMDWLFDDDRPIDEPQETEAPLISGRHVGPMANAFFASFRIAATGNQEFEKFADKWQPILAESIANLEMRIAVAELEKPAVEETALAKQKRRAASHRGRGKTKELGYG